MTDLQNRLRERQGDLAPRPEAEAARLRARLRAGELEPARLAVAAHVGDEAAAWALGTKAGTSWAEPSRPRGIVAWLRRRPSPPLVGLEDAVRGLAAHGQGACVVAARGAARMADPDWEALARHVEAVRRCEEARSVEAAADCAADAVVDVALDRGPAEVAGAVREALLAWAFGRPAAVAPGRVAREDGPLAKLAARLLEDARAREAIEVRLLPPSASEAQARVLHVLADGEPAQRMELPARALPELVARFLYLAEVDLFADGAVEATFRHAPRRGGPFDVGVLADRRRGEVTLGLR